MHISPLLYVLWPTAVTKLNFSYTCHFNMPQLYLIILQSPTFVFLKNLRNITY